MQGHKGGARKGRGRLEEGGNCNLEGTLLVLMQFAHPHDSPNALIILFRLASSFMRKLSPFFTPSVGVSVGDYITPLIPSRFFDPD